MNNSQIATLVGCAVLMFWAVGAYNRLVALRNDITKAFAPVDAQLQHRHALLLQWAEGLRELLDQAPALHDAVLAACGQLQSSCDSLRAKPSARSAATHVRLAEETLSSTRARLQAELPARQERLSGLEIEVNSDQLAAADNTLAFARAQFNVAAQTYNDAIRQIPTRLVASIFGFQTAGTL
ncbi:MAG: LemA family protein [Rhizobacter sp.]